MLEPILYSNIRSSMGLEFETYLKEPGYSFSFLKGEYNGVAREVPITHKILIGKMVDAILTEDGPVDMASDLYPIARSIAFKIRERFGNFLPLFQKQISFSGDMTYMDHVMPTRGRMDYFLPGLAVIDLKVTFEKKVRELIKFMQYDFQLWHYANLGQVKRKYIMIHSVPLGTTEMIDMGVVDPLNLLAHDFWSTKVLKFGKPVNEPV